MVNSAQNNYLLLVARIDEFIRKYYKNRLIRGGIFSVALLVILYLFFIGLEYFSYFTVGVRTVLFYAYLLAAGTILWRFVAVPVLNLKRIGKVLSHEMAAKIIGDHFPLIRDQLINTLQLNALTTSSQENNALLLASIDQKILRLRPIPFAAAINFSQNRKYLKYALIPLGFFMLILLSSPSSITDPSRRILHYQTFFEKPSPFQVTLLTHSLQAIQQEDFRVDIKLSGNEIPDMLSLETGGTEYAMVKDNPVNFHYVLKNVQHNTSFRFVTPDYTSKDYILNVLPKPIILDFDVALTYPAYLNKAPEVLSNSGDLNIPAGTVVRWKFFTRDAQRIKMRFEKEHVDLMQSGSNVFTFQKRLLNSMPYAVSVSNQYVRNSDSLDYRLEVIPDFFPSVSADELRDSVYDSRRYFKGLIKDDHGFTALSFNYAIDSTKDESSSLDSRYSSIAIPIDRSLNQQTFYYFADMASFKAGPGSSITYYFEVWDNDGVNGSKSTKTQKMAFRIPTLREREQKTETGNKAIKDELTDALNESRKLQHQIDDLNRQLFDKKTLSWQEKEQLKKLIAQQKSLEQSVEHIRKTNAEKNQAEQTFHNQDPGLLEKQQQLEKLFDEVLPNDLKKMYEELQNLLENADKDKVSDLLKQLKADNQDVEKQLDRNLELFKQLEFEQKLGETIDKLNDLAGQQTKLAEKTKEAKKTETDLLREKQQVLNKNFQDIREALNLLEKKNAALAQPNKLINTDAEETAIEKEMTESMDNLDKKNTKNASQSQKNSSRQMEQLGEKLTRMKEELQEDANSEDAAAIREILENLIRVSFEQEDQIGALRKVNRNDPKYQQLIARQKNLHDDLENIEDSLTAISKRQVMIEPFVSREIAAINRHIDEAMEAMADRNTGVANSNQQFVMTSVNNLALLLSESLKQMQQQMSAKGSAKSKGSCSKPGQGGPSMKSLRQLQQQLNQQIESLKNSQGKTGKSGQNGESSMSEQLARMAAQQEAIRRQLQGMSDQLQENGSGVSKSVKEMMQKMEQTETDLVNKMISQETVRRQQEILTRLLDSEKAEQQREMEQKRASTEAQPKTYTNPASFFKLNKHDAKESEMIRTIPPGLKPFYKSKANAYFILFE